MNTILEEPRRLMAADLEAAEAEFTAAAACDRKSVEWAEHTTEAEAREYSAARFGYAIRQAEEHAAQWGDEPLPSSVTRLLEQAVELAGKNQQRWESPAPDERRELLGYLARRRD